jgi:hypothetical protein
MRILCIVIAICLFICKDACSSIKIDIESGLGGFYRTQQWIPLKAILHNDGQNIRGTLSTDFSGMKYEIPIDLSAKSKKKVFFYLYPNKPEHEIKISLHSNKSLIFDDVTKITELDKNIIFVGVLRSSNLAKEYPFLEDSEHLARVINLTPTDLPDEWAGYDALDIMIVDNLNPELLSSAQKNAFKHWLFSGGKLLLYGNSSHTLNSGFYEDLLPSNLFEMNLYDNGNKKDSKIIQYIDGTPVIVKANYGMGEVVYSTIPFYSPMLRELAKDDNVHKELFAHNNRKIQSRKLSVTESLSESISVDEDKILLSWKYIFYFSIIYCGGLVTLYFTVFRRKNSFTFHLIALFLFPIFFSALFGTILFLFRDHNVKIDNFSLLIGTDQFKKKILSNTFCIVSAQKKKELELGLRNHSFVIEPSHLIGGENVLNPYTQTQTENSTLGNIRVNPLENRSFLFRGILETDEFIEADISWLENSITGNISNMSQCSFDNCMIVTGNSYYVLSDLGAEESIDLSSEQHKGVMDERSLSRKEKLFYDLIKSTLHESVIKGRYPVLLGWSNEPILSYSLNEKYFITTHTSLFVYFL